MIVMTLFVMSAGCADNENENEIVSLKDTKWRMVGFVDTQTGKVTEAMPTESECDRCYTLTFDTDSTASGYAYINIIGLYCKPALRMWIKTMADDREIGNLVLYYKAMESVKSYAVENDVMKIFYNDDKYYLLFKLIDK
jgi:hypothetical protein